MTGRDAPTSPQSCARGHLLLPVLDWEMDQILHVHEQGCAIKLCMDSKTPSPRCHSVPPWEAACAGTPVAKRIFLNSKASRNT